MKMIFAGLVGLVLAGSAYAETKVITVEKMHCPDCVASVKAKLCTKGTYTTCDVKILDEAKELGQVKLVTKGKEKIDMAKVEKIIGDEGYVLKK